MDQPLGMAVGNALEVKEAIATLRGEGPKDFTELCMVLGSQMLMAGGKALSVDRQERHLQKSLKMAVPYGNCPSSWKHRVVIRQR